MRRLVTILIALIGAVSGVCGGDAASAVSYYKEPPLFSLAPDPGKPLQPIERFGPVGLALELIPPAFTLRIKSVEEGSPAESSGTLKPGQIIESINGARLKDIDPRIQLGDIITEAEATDGVIKLTVKDSPSGTAQEVIVKIPVFGAYSKTWPLNCPKSDKVVRDFADFLAKPGATQGFGGIAMLFLLGTGEDKDLGPVRQWVRGLADKEPSRYSWHLGYGGIPLCEYYLRTGDQSALPIIQKWVDAAVAGEYFGGWSHKGVAGNVTYGGGGGHLNAGGTMAATFLMLAKECGANIPDDTFHRVLIHFFRWAGRGNNPYGNGRPEMSLVDNGKNGTLAFTMAAAAALTPDGEKSIYASARDVAALTSFYTTTYMLHGHTGGGIGEIWRSAAMGLLYEKRPRQYRSFMEARRWHYELSRRFDGSFGIVGGARYDNTDWGSAYPLTYIIPRKTLRITGAPPGKFSKQYKLPERPWGTKADDFFDSIEPATLPDGTRPDLSNETIAADSGKSMLARLNGADVDDATLRRYAHHPDAYVRLVAARRVMGLCSVHFGKPTNSGEIRPELTMELFRSVDPRVRCAIFQAITERLSGEELMALLGQQGFDKLIGMLRDPSESWWVQDAALQLIGRTQADAVLPHLDLILEFLKHEEWWLQEAALKALAPVVGDKRCYRKVIPAISEFLRTWKLWNAANPIQSWGGTGSNLNQAEPEIQRYAAESFKEALVGYAGQKTAPGGLDISRVYDRHVDFIAGALVKLEGGYDLLYQTRKKKAPDNPLGMGRIFLDADVDKFSPELKEVYKPVMRDQVIPAYVGRNRRALLSEAASTSGPKKSRFAVDDLVHYYNQIGIDDYNWNDFGPGWNSMKWDYFSFAPKEEVPFNGVRWRYRKVTYPPGMDRWFAPDFDPVTAGWKTGCQPFGQFDGKLVTQGAPCTSGICRCGEPMKTLWENEVLLLRGKFQFPGFKEGYRYRLLVGGMSHVGRGNGFRIYINGKQLVEREIGTPKGGGGVPIGCLEIGKESWPDFDREVVIAATGFLAYGAKDASPSNPVPQGHFSLWLQEMKVPPLGEQEILRSAQVVPMLSSAWQALQDPEKEPEDADEGKFGWDGKFVANAKLLGEWEQLGQVAKIEEFNPGKPVKANKRNPLQKIAFKEQGKTNEPLKIWSGDLLMDLDNNQALKLEVRTIGGSDYLFIEAGGFSAGLPAGWKAPWYALKRSVR